MLGELLGSGGLGAVYAAKHRLTHRDVAVKVLRGSADSSPAAAERFQREAQAAAKIEHPNVVQVFDMGRDPDGTTYMVLEKLRGEALSALLKRRRRLELPELLDVLLPVMDAVRAAHAAGVVHRDIKPANIFISVDGQDRVVPKLLDFGVAKFTSQQLLGLTTEGQVVGTPQYMAPEQISGKDVGPATDVWAVAVVFYHCLSGFHPFRGENFAALYSKITAGQRKPLLERLPALDPALAEVIERALSVSPDERYAEMGAFRDALKERAPPDAGSGKHLVRPEVAPHAPILDPVVDVEWESEDPPLGRTPSGARGGPRARGASAPSIPKAFDALPETVELDDPVPRDRSSLRPLGARRPRKALALIATGAAALLGLGVWAAVGRSTEATGAPSPSATAEQPLMAEQPLRASPSPAIPSPSPEVHAPEPSALTATAVPSAASSPSPQPSTKARPRRQPNDLLREW